MKSLRHSIILLPAKIMKHQIKAFGIVKDIVGGKEIELELAENATVSDMIKTLYAIYPRLISLNSLFVAVNREYSEGNKLLVEKDEIALIPPVSGG